MHSEFRNSRRSKNSSEQPAVWNLKYATSGRPVPQHEEKAYLQNIRAFSAPVHAFALNFNLFPIPHKLNFHLKQRPSLTGSLGHLKSGHFSFGSHEKSAEGVHKAPVATAVAKQLLKTS